MQEKKLNGNIAVRGLAFASFLLLMVLVLAACGGAPAGDLEVGDKAPDFSLKATNGQTVSLADYAGTQPVLLYFHMAVG